jgi:hypothetical protein
VGRAEYLNAGRAHAVVIKETARRVGSERLNVLLQERITTSLNEASESVNVRFWPIADTHDENEKSACRSTEALNDSGAPGRI